MIKLLLSSVDLLRKNHKHGEEYYWILYYAFLSPHELKNTEEILEELEKHVPSISYRTYYRRRQAAINALSSILWGFSAKGTLETLNKFFPKKNRHFPYRHSFSILKWVPIKIDFPNCTFYSSYKFPNTTSCSIYIYLL